MYLCEPYLNWRKAIAERKAQGEADPPPCRACAEADSLRRRAQEVRRHADEMERSATTQVKEAHPNPPRECFRCGQLFDPQSKATCPSGAGPCLPGEDEPYPTMAPNYGSDP